jgi:hypothetical protein
VRVPPDWAAATGVLPAGYELLEGELVDTLRFTNGEVDEREDPHLS